MMIGTSLAITGRKSRRGLSLDFTNGLPPGLTFSRTGAGMAQRLDGSWVSFLGQRTNKVAIFNANPADLTGLTKAGDAAAILTLVDDPAALLAAGLQDVATSGKVFRFDNSAGTGSAQATVTGTVGNTNPHTVSAYVRGSGACRVQLSAVSSVGTTALTGSYVRVSNLLTPLGTTNVLSIRAEAGAVVYFILPQLEEASVVTDVIVTTGSATTVGAQPRITDRGLLVEEARTNSFPNGACAGTTGGPAGSNMPDTWGLGGIPGTVSVARVGGGVEDGLPYVDLKWSGTPSATSGTGPYFSPVGGTGSIVASTGQTWTHSFFARIIGTPVGVTGYTHLVTGRTNTGTSTEGTSNVSIAMTSVRQRFTLTYAMTNASTERVTSGFQIGFTNGVPIDVTVRIYLPQLEQGAFATSPIVTNGAAATRGADQVSMTGLGSLLTFPFTFAAKGALGANSYPALATLNDGSAANAVFHYRASAGGVVYGQVASGGGATNISLGAVAVGTPFTVVSRVDATGMRTSKDGSAVVVGTRAVGPLNTLWIGFSASGPTYANDYVQRVSVTPGGLTDAQLQAVIP